MFQKGVLKLEIKKEELAIAFVPCQSWGELYDKDQALKAGTIFKELDKPFYAAEQIPAVQEPLAEEASKSPQQKERESLMLELQKVSFVLDDLRLYLDTHPEEPEGLAVFKKALEKRKELKRDFAMKFYPLTPDCMADSSQQPLTTDFCWQKGPAPWEGGCI